MKNKKAIDIINTLNLKDLQLILEIILNKNPSLNIEDIMKEYKKNKDVDIEEVAESLFTDLNFIDVEDLWSSSGSTKYGYVEPVERADEMVEETLEPYFDELKKYVELSLFNEAKSSCKGILKGIKKFEDESPSEFSEWVTDITYNFIPMIFDKWKEICKNKSDINEIKEYIIKELNFKAF